MLLYLLGEILLVNLLSWRNTLSNPKQRVVAVALVVLAWAPSAMAGGRHARPAQTAPAVAPNANVRSYSLDSELEFRAAHQAPTRQTRAIVTLRPGAQLPSEFARFAKYRLDILNGYALTVPNGMLQRLAADPSVFRVHYDRPAAKFDYRTTLTTGSLAINHMRPPSENSTDPPHSLSPGPSSESRTTEHRSRRAVEAMRAASISDASTEP